MARQWISFAIWLLLYVKVSLQDESCSSPTVTPNMYTTTDGMIVSDIAFIVELSVTCQNGAKDLSLYAVINDVTVPVVKSLDNNKYQFSWTRDPKNVQNGEQTLRVYDEEGFSVLRKVQRSGEDTSNLKPLFTVTINHPGTYQGPWVQSELVAVITALILWYLAYSTKMKIQL